MRRRRTNTYADDPPSDGEDADAPASPVERRPRSAKQPPRPSACQRVCSWLPSLVLLFLVLFLVLCMALVGGPRELYECCEPMWQPELPQLEQALPWPEQELALAGKVALVTGANRGYGYGVATHMAEQGARVLMACRTADTGAADNLTAALLRDHGPSHPGSVEMLHLDLTDLPSVALFAASSGLPALDIVILNAAVVDDRSAPYKLTASSGTTLNRMYTVNYLANVVLIQELIRHGKLP